MIRSVAFTIDDTHLCVVSKEDWIHYPFHAHALGNERYQVKKKRPMGERY